MVQEEKKMLAC